MHRSSASKKSSKPPPEGPEVRLTTDWLKTNIQDNIVRDIKQLGRFSRQSIVNIEKIKNNKIINIRCRGKVIVLDFENNISAISTLGMSGRWTRIQDKHTALILWCEKPPTRGILPVYYDDQRRFGNFKVVLIHEATSKLDELGWDALAEPLLFNKICSRISKYLKKPIAEVLLKQDVFAGVGNYIRAEVMYMAGIHPQKLVADITDEEWNLLCSAIVNVMQEAYAKKGTTLENYYGGNGERGDHVDFLKVYHKTMDPHGHPVSFYKDKNDRTVWWVPAVQGANK